MGRVELDPIEVGSNLKKEEGGTDERDDPRKSGTSGRDGHFLSEYPRQGLRAKVMSN